MGVVCGLNVIAIIHVKSVIASSKCEKEIPGSIIYVVNVFGIIGDGRGGGNICSSTFKNDTFL